MNLQVWVTLALAVFAFFQAFGIIIRVIVAYKQYKLDWHKFEYRKESDIKRIQDQIDKLNAKDSNNK